MGLSSAFILSSSMTNAKSVYVLMLALIIVLSGCFGATTDDSDAQDSGTDDREQTDDPEDIDREDVDRIRGIWYVSGIANHTCIPEEGTQTTQGRQINPDGNESSDEYRECIDDDETMEQLWIIVENYTVIHQDEGTGINVHSYATSMYGGRIGTVCSNGAIAGWGLHPDNGDYYGNSDPNTLVEGLLPFAGLECDHYLFGFVYSDEPLEVHWHVAYEVFSLSEGPHN